MKEAIVDRSNFLGGNARRKLWESIRPYFPKKSVHHLSLIFKLAGSKVLSVFTTAMTGSFTLLVFEFLLAAAIQRLLQNLGLSKDSSAKLFEAFNLWQITLAVFVINAFRSGLQFGVLQLSLFGNELLKCRLNLLAVSDMTIRSNSRYIAGSKILSLMNEIFPRTSGFFASFTCFMSLGIQCFGLLIIMLFTGWRETLMAVLGLFVIGSISMLLGRKIQQHSKGMPTRNANIIRGVERIARNWLFIKISKFETREYNTIARELIGYSQLAIRSSFLSNLTATLPSLLGSLLLSCIIYASVTFWGTASAVLLTLLYLLIRFVQNIGAASGLYGELSIYLPHLRRSMEYVASIAPADVESSSSPSRSLRMNGRLKSETQIMNTLSVSSLTGSEYVEELPPPSFELKNVSYSYPGSNQPVFKNFNLTISAGEHFGIKGRSGSGKSTLIGILLGFVRPDDGAVLVDGQPQSFAIFKKCMHIGYVGPEPFLINGSILENLTYGLAIKPPIQEVEAILAKLGLDHEILKNREAGLDSPIEENGDGLSAGQKQRLCLARALLKKPNLLILDEPTANLDNKSEKVIAEAVMQWRGQVTAVVISHRPGVFENMDRIYNLETEEFEL